MTIYHDNNVEVREPKVIVPCRAMDFGSGFMLVFATEKALSFIRFDHAEALPSPPAVRRR